MIPEGTILDVTRRVAEILRKHDEEGNLENLSPEDVLRQRFWHQGKHWVQTLCGLDSLTWTCRLQEPCPSVPYLNTCLRQHILSHKPLSRMVNKRAFWKEEFFLNAWTLDPRSETEGLVALAVLWGGLKNSGARILDLGTGTGCLILSLLSEYPEATGIGVDVEERVFEVTQKNAQALGVHNRVQWVHSHWLDALPPPSEEKDKFSCILSNPPYISQSDLSTLPPSVSCWDPNLALDGGMDGLSWYRVILSQSGMYLRRGGVLFLEIGDQQGPEVQALAESAYAYVKLKQDFSGRSRYCVASQTPLDFMVSPVFQ